jgi:ferric-dicitrate binding protein FerR (iron transport regulator)
LNDIEPGHSGAVLTLSNGKKIILDSAENGLLASQGKSDVVKVDGQLVYKTQNNSANEVLYNTMTTAKGRQYQLVLADGSKVWLNAASSITYPTTFNKEERKVEITGEAYFEINKVFKKSDLKERVPFIVIINSVSEDKRQVQVLGTHFNVMAYDDEPAAKTTLLEGSVKVLNDGKSVTIRPGEQAVLSNEKVSVTTTDVNEEIAWKNGMFSFNNATIEKIMRQVERWYDVDIVYNGAKPKGHYRGEVPMNVNASEMLKVLAVSGIHFKIDGKKIIVMN